MQFSRQENYSGLPCFSPGYLLDPGIEPKSPTLQADALTSEPPGKQTLQTNITGMCGECSQCAHSVLTTLGLAWLMACVLSQSTLLRLQVALQGNCLKWALCFMHFPGLTRSGARVLCKDRLGWACVLCPSQVRAVQATRCLVSALSQVGHAS